MSLLLKISMMSVAVVMLASCGVAKRNAMSKMDDQSLTEAFQKRSSDRICSDLEFNSGNDRYQIFARAEAEQRNLGDCSKAHMLCLEIGYKYKSEEYANCRIKLAQGGYGSSGGNSNSTTKAMGNALSDWGRKMQDGTYYPKPAPVKNCNSIRVGNSVQTTCY